MLLLFQSKHLAVYESDNIYQFPRLDVLNQVYDDGSVSGQVNFDMVSFKPKISLSGSGFYLKKDKKALDNIK